MTNDDSDDLWGMEIRYNTTTLGISKPQFNGNIAEMVWGKVLPSGFTVATSAGYAFSYDPLNRLTNAQSVSKINGAWNNNGNYNEAMTYDKNGNIGTLNRYAYVSGTKQLIDMLNYTYTGNQVIKIDDASAYSGTAGFINGATTASEYGYDVNGNMNRDDNNKINITYNLLNLPQTINSSTGTNMATYTYDASGRKLKKTTPGGSTYYMGGLQFDGTTLSFMATPEGRVYNNNGSFNYEYFHKDHLGNVRMSFDNTGTGNTAAPIQLDDYFPFGYRQPSQSYVKSDVNKYLYNGKEVQETGDYDSQARFYDPIIIRTPTVDPHANNYCGSSPYSWVGNNPIVNIDPTGMDWFHHSESGSIMWHDSKDETLNHDDKNWKNIGNTLDIEVTSYIHESTDIPVPGVAGVKLQTTYSIKGNYNKKGKFTGFTTTSKKEVGTTFGFLKGGDDVDGKTESFAALSPNDDGSWSGGFEHHTEVNWKEKPGMYGIFGNVVDVNQKVQINLNKQGMLQLGIGHGTYPSVGIDTYQTGRIYDFREYSFIETHSVGIANQILSLQGAIQQAISNKINMGYSSTNKSFVNFTGFTSGK